MEASHDSAAGTFTLTKGDWSNTYPIADLPRWLAFYRRQRENYPKAGKSYDGSVAALERLAAELGIDA